VWGGRNCVFLRRQVGFPLTFFPSSQEKLNFSSAAVNLYLGYTPVITERLTRERQVYSHVQGIAQEKFQ
jgi:hypothetical protein